MFILMEKFFFVFMKQLISTGLKRDFFLFISIAIDLPVSNCVLNFCVNSKTVVFEKIHPKIKVMIVLHEVRWSGNFVPMS